MVDGMDTVDMEESNVFDEKVNTQATVFNYTGVCSSKGMIKKCKEAKPRCKPGFKRQNNQAFAMKVSPNQMMKLRGDSGLNIENTLSSPDKFIAAQSFSVNDTQGQNLEFKNPVTNEVFFIAPLN